MCTEMSGNLSVEGRQNGNERYNDLGRYERFQGMEWEEEKRGRLEFLIGALSNERIRNGKYL